ncbi:MAG TPA: RidA family protein [Thermoflexales bacterium]|nr:RidA family protein [Thermoflexales bacterium]HQW34786.1 RidA family protein [Thermoflexales bacterium]HQX75515.1 RidA family protein [Thermoflexales bacterium]HQZ23397.1 RidA family protein [Thermoflexales bacterium]HRA00710.1 RidA family protein [Thermoflexales bacterium]
MSQTQYFSSHPKLPFSEAVRVGDLLYLSGNIGDGADGKLVSGGIQAETRQAMENIKEVLAKHGLTMNNVVKCLVMMADMNEWKAMNEVYVTYFPEHLPARSAFGATALAMGARMEIECIAAF